MVRLLGKSREGEEEVFDDADWSLPGIRQTDYGRRSENSSAQHRCRFADVDRVDVLRCSGHRPALVGAIPLPNGRSCVTLWLVTTSIEVSRRSGSPSLPDVRLFCCDLRLIADPRAARR